MWPWRLYGMRVYKAVNPSREPHFHIPNTGGHNFLPPKMAPNLREQKELEVMEPQNQEIQYKNKIKWNNVATFTYIHLAGFYGAYLIIFQAKWQTIVWTFVLYELTAIAVVAGVHRLWSHNAYKVKLPLELFLAFWSTVAAQKSIYRWARDHRVHHKYTDTDADPHDSRRGFFYSHIGWLLCEKNPKVTEKGKIIYLEDLRNNPVVMFQHRYYYRLVVPACLIMPTIVPMYFWGETLKVSWFTAVMFRYCFTLNLTWLINSAAHMFGIRPYDKNIRPTENLLVSIGIAGDGWHNYHHSFPWDYRSSELGGYRINAAAAFIDLMAMIGQAYDLKTASPKTVLARKKRTGELSNAHENTKKKLHSWGWGDDSIPYGDNIISSGSSMPPTI